MVAFAFAGLIVAGSLATLWLVRHIVAVHRLTRGVGDTIFYSADGRPWFHLDEHRHDVPLAQISPHLQHAVIAVEDRRFYRHLGVDPLALGRAMGATLAGNTQGGSTITQQLARTLFLSNVQTFARKLKEAALALMIEQQLTKAQILEFYLNRVYLSSGVYGVEPLSQNLFGKPARDLTLAEAALVAGLIRAPSALSPWGNLDGAIRRSHLVLARMREEGYISDAEERAARRAALRIQPYPHANESRAGYAKDYLRQQFRNRFGGDHPPEWAVHTTFVPELQEAAERAVAYGLRRMGRADLQAALVAVDPRTGDLLALVGGRDFVTTPYNRATRSRRQPGSAFKPLVYAAALERGLSPVTVLSGLDAIDPQGPEEWVPQNARGEQVASLTLREALLESNNRAAVALQQRIGTRAVLALGRDVGLRDLPDVPSLALGSGTVTPLDLTLAFATFPNGGLAVQPRAIVRVTDGTGATVVANDATAERVLSPASAFQMVSMLEDVVDRGTASSARAYGVRFAIGGKTGTTNEFKDAWFIGFSSAVVAGVWVGFDQPATIGRDAYGSHVALPIWADFMKRTTRARPPDRFAPPPGLREEPLCRVSYLRPVERCPTYTEYFKEGDQIPTALCPIHRGTLKQRASRAIEGLLSAIGRKLRGIFR